jgi:hypothetical protein
MYMCLSFMASGNQPDTVSRQYNWSERCGVSGKSFEWKLIYCCEVTLCSLCKLPLIIGHCKQVHSVCRHCTHCDSSGVSAKSLERKPRYFCECVVYYK